MFRKATPKSELRKFLNGDDTTKKPKWLTARKRADSAFAKYIRNRDGNKCCIGGCEQPYAHPNCGHFMSRIFMATRFDERNCNCQCARHNKLHNENAEPYRRFMKEKYGEDVIKELDTMTRTTRKYSVDELLELEKEYKERMKGVQ